MQNPGLVFRKCVFTMEFMSFESEISLIRAQFGGLEEIRSRLQMSRREICQTLMVDPSAWSRWVGQGEDKAPPHVYRTLSLLMGAQPLKWSEPSLDFEEAQRGSATGPQVGALLDGKEGRLLRENLELQIEALKSQIQKKEELTSGWKILLLLTVGLVIYQLIF